MQVDRGPLVFQVGLVGSRNRRRHDIGQRFVCKFIKLVLIVLRIADWDWRISPLADDYVRVNLVPASLLMLLSSRVKVASIDHGQGERAAKIFSKAFGKKLVIP